MRNYPQGGGRNFVQQQSCDARWDVPPVYEEKKPKKKKSSAAGLVALILLVILELAVIAAVAIHWYAWIH